MTHVENPGEGSAGSSSLQCTSCTLSKTAPESSLTARQPLALGEEHTSNSQGAGFCTEAVSLLCLGRFEQVPWLSGKDAPLVVKYDIEKPENGHV